MSHLNINVDKTKAILIGSEAGSNDRLCQNLKQDDNKEFEVSGNIFSTNLSEFWLINTERKLEEINRLFANWRKRNLTLIGKNTVINTLALSKLVNIFSQLPNSPEV